MASLPTAILGDTDVWAFGIGKGVLSEFVAFLPDLRTQAAQPHNAKRSVRPQSGAQAALPPRHQLLSSLNMSENRGMSCLSCSSQAVGFQTSTQITAPTTITS